jgi:hypothetical protein
LSALRAPDAEPGPPQAFDPAGFPDTPNSYFLNVFLTRGLL